MLMTCQPLFDCIRHVKGLKKDQAPVIYLTPQGQRFNQPLAEQLSEKHDRIILLTGHYEGIDQRVRDALVDQEISIGDYVLTNGDLPAMILVDALSRLLSGVIGKDESHLEESFSTRLDRKLEYPHYTRPEEFEGMRVPDILLSGHHKAIEDWRKSACKEVE